MVAELIVEKFKKREREIGRQEGEREGRQEGRQEAREEWRAWYERQQSAFREGRPFTELPPGESPEAGGDGQEPSQA